MNKKKLQIFSRLGFLILLAAAVIFLNQCGSDKKYETSGDNQRTGILEVHFIDVGQGDAILVETDDAAMLIDAGENNKGKTVVKYLKSQNITKLDYVIGTHPHSDHIGGLDKVLNSFQVDHVILPEVSNNTKTFEDVLDALEKNNLTITRPVVGEEYSLGQATFTILAPNSASYEELNDYSIVIRLVNGSNSFLLTGDAGIASEEEMQKNGLELSADVLKIAHHGSITGTSKNFLDAVNPTYAVISVGKDNDYDHPHAETLQSIKDRDIKLYRTDMQGTVIFTSDGKNISVNTDNYIITDTDLDK